MIADLVKMQFTRKTFWTILVLSVFLGNIVWAQTAASSSINLSIPLGGSGDSFTVPVKLVLFLTLLTFLPALFISATSFTRIVVVLSFLRQAMGMPQAPPNQILIGLALFMTFSIMAPTFELMHAQGLKPYMAGQISDELALERTILPLREFMYRQTRRADIDLMMTVAKKDPIQKFEDLPSMILIPAFIISELKTAFQIGFMLYVPFVVMDMIVAMVLLAMGMMVLPPVVISLPFKIMLFVVVDGWDLVIGSIMKSFR